MGRVGIGDMNKTEKRIYCAGCEQNFYNGNNSYGINECWNLEDAELVNLKKVHMNQSPPWTQPPIKVLSCYSQKGYIFVGEGRTY